MPIFRYFMFVGGALLALLFVVDYVLPSEPATQAVATATSDQPPIRIRSDRHLPDRVVLDTTQPTIAAPVVTAAVVAPQPPVQERMSDTSAKARVRETFAQFTPAAPKPEAAAAKKTPVQPKRRVARAHPAPQFGLQFGRPMMVAQQPHFGLFNMTW